MRAGAPPVRGWGKVAVPRSTATTESWELDGARQSAVHSAQNAQYEDTNGLRTLARHSTDLSQDTRYRY